MVQNYFWSLGRRAGSAANCAQCPRRTRRQRRGASPAARRRSYGRSFEHQRARERDLGDRDFGHGRNASPSPRSSRNSRRASAPAERPRPARKVRPRRRSTRRICAHVAAEHAFVKPTACTVPQVMQDESTEPTRCVAITHGIPLRAPGPRERDALYDNLARARGARLRAQGERPAVICRRHATTVTPRRPRSRRRSPFAHVARLRLGEAHR